MLRMYSELRSLYPRWNVDFLCTYKYIPAAERYA